MSTIFLVLTALIFAGLVFAGFQYFYHKRLEQEEASRQKVQALMEAYRQRHRRKSKKNLQDEKVDLNQLLAETESIPVVLGQSQYWLKIWYLGLAVVVVLGMIWLAVEVQMGKKASNSSQGLSQPKAAERQEANHVKQTGTSNTRESEPKLQLLKMSHSHYANQVVINGLVLNVSQDTLKNITVVIIFEDAEENFLTSAQNQLVFAMLLPGEESPFKVQTIEDHRMVGYGANFRTHEGAPLPNLDSRESPKDYINPPSKVKKHEEHEEEGHEGTQ